MFSLARVMNELIHLGFPLTEVIAMVTRNAAVAIGLHRADSSLLAESTADVA